MARTLKTVVIVSEPENKRATLSVPVAHALAACFMQRGWNVVPTTKRITEEPDLIAGWGFQDVIHNAWDRWPHKILHVDAGYWTRTDYNKLELGGRWMSATGGEYPQERLRAQHVKVRDSQRPGNRILICGMSAKAAHSLGLRPEEWERQAIATLRAAGAECVYRPKPTWPDARPLKGASFDRSSSIESSFKDQIHGVVSHHSNATIDALAAGLPIYVETGIAKPLSASLIENVAVATAPNREMRMQFLCEVAWHQWTLRELEEGTWLKSPAPLANHPLIQALEYV